MRSAPSQEEAALEMMKGTCLNVQDLQLLIIGGSFGLREFTQIRYDAQKLHSKMDPALEERIRKNKISLESEYEKLKNSDFDDWKNIRGPRPWEDSKSFQEQQQQVLHSKPS
ncbi:cytochrome c oxidase assembly protein COX16 homolog, mitochondrial isoform X3 [Dermochelys coriacea]|uniref:cytochrome c oxidase assembly protein COX16 homolog, mitochondrial isoform X3 n=1 Tax=Dermochelys coriacea TaxID=27794 RepID=UPI001CA8E1A4|nr:cytochrome c oxidase assembly protein COX16 homolog, mitochondrial isoform X3 [Dermochelys coriacea]